MDEFENESILNKIINNIISKSQNVQAYILVGNNKDDLKDKALTFAKVFICPFNYKVVCDRCNICRRINDGNFGELKIIEPVNNIIKKDSVINLKNSFQTNSIEGKNQVYIIYDVELLNQSAANSILKFLEEPDSNTIAIFTTSNFDLVMSTISSRCQVIRLGGKKDEFNKNFILEFCGLTEEFYDLVLNFFISMEKNQTNVIIRLKDDLLNYFTTKESLLSVLKLFLLAYKDMLNYKVLGKMNFFNENKEIIVLEKSQNEKQIIKKISFVLENMKKLKYNVNILLFMYNLIIGIGEISNDKRSRN